MTSSEGSDSSSDFEDLDSASDDPDEDIPESVVANEQWVKLIEFCSFKSKSEQSVTKNIGIEKLCQATDVNFGDKDKVKDGWILKNDNREETLIVSFQTSIFINGIHIYESLHPGSIVKLEMLECERNKWWPMWQRKTSPKKHSAAHTIFKPPLRRYHIQSNTIRLTIDPRYTDQIAIQAIKLLGSNIFDTTLHHIPLVESMSKLYEQALHKKNTNVQFIFNDQIINAHRNILCCRSAYFRSLLLNDFLEKSQTKPLELTDVDYETFHEILYFIYTGAYHQSLPHDIAMKVMVYANKINLVTATTAAIEHICRYLHSDHDLILTVYCFVKKASPAFDLLLEYVYDLCSEHLNEICKRKDFMELDKELMIDIICQTAERREKREVEKRQQSALDHNYLSTTDEDE